MRHRPSTLESWRLVAAEARGLIRLKCADPSLRIADIALTLNVSVSKLRRALGEAGTDFTRELVFARMDHAARLLARGYWSGVAGQQSGYRSLSHFSVAFRSHYGVTPQEFRRAVRLDGRLKWRARRNNVSPVGVNTREYDRRRRRWREDERALGILVRNMLPAGGAALRTHARPMRPVFDLKDRQMRLFLASQHSRIGTEGR
jgi:AraC-like DNA-binding protein